MEDMGSGHAALLIANYPIMTLHTPLVSRSSYPITAQQRWLKSPESAVTPFYATDNLLSGVFLLVRFSFLAASSVAFFLLRSSSGCLVVFALFVFCVVFASVCGASGLFWGWMCVSFRLGSRCCFRPGVTIARSGSSQLIFSCIRV